jgi:hypothetical protein
MHIHLPRPLHGWREFVGEVAIIVLGILIALASEQLIQARYWHREVRDFRNAIDHELGRDLGVYDLNLEQRPCLTRRLADLERLLAQSRAGRQLMMIRQIGRPLSFSQYTSTWDNKGAEVMEHLPLDVRLRYGELYDEFANADVVRLSERDVWRSLAQFDANEPLDHSDRMRLRELLTRAEQLDSAMRGNHTYILNLARPMNIQPIPDPQNPHIRPGDEFCLPLFASDGR